MWKVFKVAFNIANCRYVFRDHTVSLDLFRFPYYVWNKWNPVESLLYLDFSFFGCMIMGYAGQDSYFVIIIIYQGSLYLYAEIVFFIPPPPALFFSGNEYSVTAEGTKWESNK